MRVTLLVQLRDDFFYIIEKEIEMPFAPAVDMVINLNVGDRKEMNLYVEKVTWKHDEQKIICKIDNSRLLLYVPDFQKDKSWKVQIIEGR